MSYAKRLMVIGGNLQFLPAELACADQFKETAGCGLHIGSGVVGFLKGLTKKEFMQLDKGGQLKFPATAAGDPAKTGSLLRAGIQHRQALQGIFLFEAIIFRPGNIDVESYVLPYNKFGAG